MDPEQLAVKEISFDTFAALQQRTQDTWSWACPFVLPFWLETVHRHLGSPGRPFILAVHDRQEPVGILPLAIDDDTARFLGDPDVCDYQDLIAAPGAEGPVLAAVLAYLRHRGLRSIDWCTLRPDAAVLAALHQVGPDLLQEMAFETVDVTYEIELPASWDGYLQQLNGKQRHEVRRKMRRLENEARFTYRRVPADGDLESAVATFIALFRRNRTDKAAFMSGAMPGFFKALMQRLDQEGLLRLQMLDVNDQPVATVLCFDYQGVRYLYNSGYDAEHDHLSVGILSKVFGIRSAIALGCRRFDFLRGAEIYKKRTGGKEIALCRCRGRL